MSFCSSDPSLPGSEAACHRPSHRKDFQIAIICALPLEYDAATLLIDEFWDEDDRQYGRTSGDVNTYRSGRIGMHNVVLMLLPNMGKAAVAGSAASLRTSYSSLRIAFLVGVCGGVPFLGSQEALLGDVVIGEAVVQYDFGRQYPGEFVPKGALYASQNMPNKDIRTLLAYFKTEMGMEDLRKSTARHLRVLQQTAEMRHYRRSYQYPGFTEDKLFAAAYRHKHQDRSCCNGAERFCHEAAQSSCAEVGCDKKQLVSRERLEAKRYLDMEEAQRPEIYIGRVASADTVMKSGVHRDQIAKQHNIVAFEMEGAGLWDEAPCIVVKGICDYSDSHKNKSWQPFAAATAAAVVKAMLERYTITDEVELPAPSSEPGQQRRLFPTNVELTRTSKSTTSFTSEPNGTKVLQDAILEFQTILTPEQRCELRKARNVPDVDAVLIFTAELDLLNRNRNGISVASRLLSLLQSVRDFSAVVETLGSAHNGLAPLIWGIVRLTMLVWVPHLVPLCCNDANNKERELQQHAVNMELHSTDVNTAIALAEAKAHHQDRQLQTLCQKKSSKSQKLRRLLSQDNDNSAMIAELQSEVDRRRAMERRQQLLDSLSTHDYVTPLKQSRRKRYSGTLEWLFKTREFDRWLNDSECPFLWCSGKIGSGKTILTASLIDKLLTDKRRSDVFVSFFIIQFDDQQSLNAETILKSIIQQALHASRPSREIESSLERMILSLSSGLKDLLVLLRKTAASFKTFYIAIDGIDECSKQDRGDLLGILSSVLATERNTKLFLASRDSVSREIQTTFTIADEHLSMECSSVQADIATYVEGIVQDKLQSEELIVEDLSLIEDIKAALTEGADGMFLWVSFQIDELALQRCDDDIRRAIHNLPKDLEETFNRVLDRIISRRNEDIAKRMFRWVAAAREPLSLDQLSEVVFLEIAQPYLTPERRPNGMKHTSSWCENLVQVDEELQTVQFVHQSVQQFFIEKSHEGRHNQFLIKVEDVDHYIGEICVTYLNLNDFKKTLARRQQPLPPMPPIAMAGTALRPQWKAVASCSSLWKFNLDTRGGSKAATALEAAALGDNGGGSRESMAVGHPFLTYASIYWIFHTTRFQEEKSKTWSLWKEMVQDGHDLAKRPWDEGEFDKSNTALFKWGCNYRHYALVRFLIQANAATTDDKNQVLLDAVSQGDITLLDTVLETEDSGLEIDHACQIAVKDSQLDILRRLITAGADAQAALFAAAQNGKIDAIEYLLTVSDGQIAIKAAVENNDREAGRHLVRSGVDVQPVSEAAIKASKQEAIQCLRGAGVDGQVLLRAAMKTGDTNYIQDRLAAGGESYFLLKTAVRNGDQDLFEYLLNARIDGETVLRAAARRGDHHLVETLLAAGACGSRELEEAVQSSDLDAIKSLLAAGVDGAGALELSILHGTLGDVRNLLAAGLDVDAKGSIFPNSSALQLAMLEGRQDVFDALLDAGADVNVVLSRGIVAQTALLSAAESGHMDIVELLLSYGADINADPADEIGRTALQVAVEKGHLDIARFLLKAGADIDPILTSSDLSRNALHDAFERGHLETVERLLDAGADVNAEPTTHCSRTALQAAARHGHEDVVERLLAAGADVNAKGPTFNWGNTALQDAVLHGHLRVVERLLDAGADVNALPDWTNAQTALQAAAMNGNLVILDKLLAAGVAAARERIRLVSRLLAAGADIDSDWAASRNGQLAVQCPAEDGYPGVAEDLLDAGAVIDGLWVAGKKGRAAVIDAGKKGCRYT
ncbi:Ankyrin repeat domain-containing protein 50 [Trichoderma ghanense]|uniref:Ankyrin repeat domain-containing protein 50 n=1 Tax=Trichoderma ghanense TaxID=65468 RepID=A0ABY2H5B8_9HYPO